MDSNDQAIMLNTQRYFALGLFLLIVIKRKQEAFETVNNHHLMRITGHLSDDLHAASHSRAAMVQGPVLSVKGSQGRVIFSLAC